MPFYRSVYRAVVEGRDELRNLFVPAGMGLLRRKNTRTIVAELLSKRGASRTGLRNREFAAWDPSESTFTRVRVAGGPARESR